MHSTKDSNAIREHIFHKSSQTVEEASVFFFLSTIRELSIVRVSDHSFLSIDLLSMLT